MAVSDDNNVAIPSEKQFPVVGIGASAGGLDAFKLFLKSIPDKSGMAYVYVQHLSPDHESHLPDILKKHTKTPIQTITDNIHLEPDNIYVIPPGRMLTSFDGVLKLDVVPNRKMKTIDTFFSSLAVVHQGFAVGVVLSGSLDDGALGLQVIKSYGGLTFAQDEASAAFESMPRSAVKAGGVDFVLPADKIVPKLIEINHPFHTNYSDQEVKRNEPEEDDEVFRQLLTVLRVRRGVDFTNYKLSTIKRRIVRRMALIKIDKPKDYLSFLRENKAEQDALYNDMLISVTNFFRDTQSFNYLCNTIFPRLLHDKTIDEPLRIWVAGCATGEEAYSIAICLQEYLGDKVSARKIQIFATDISEIAISKARAGIYNAAELEGVSALQLEQFFNKLDGSYQVNKSVRDMCVFAHHNLLKDPPFSKINLVSCRNVMIYMEPVLQKRALTTFHYALNGKGYLMLGKSETVGANSDLFSAINPHEKIYQSKGPLGRFRQVDSDRNERKLKDIDKDAQDNTSEKDIQKTADAILLSQYTPAGVMVNEAHDIIQFRGKTDTWLSVPPGKPSFNILKLARESLSFEIRNLLHLAKTKEKTVRKEGIFFKVGDTQQYVNIEVIPILDASEAYYLILFQNSIISASVSAENASANLKQPQENINAWEQRIEQLEKELSQTREDMRAVTEAQEAANEELQSANEELLSGSEELQSLNEELETSKEELQSTNEEITIVNNELLDRNDQLNSSRKYIEEIFNTIHEPLVIMDKELKVLRATDGFYQLFRVGEKETEGSFLYELGNQQWDIPELRNQLENILPEQGPFKSFEIDHIFNSIGRRTMELSARQFDTLNREKLTLLAIHDITDKRKVEQGLAEAERLLAESKDRLHFAVESAGVGTWDFNPITGELIFDARNREFFGLLPGDSVNYAVFLERLHPDDRIITEKAIRDALESGSSAEFNAAFRTIAHHDQKIRWIKLKGRPYFENGKATRFIGTSLDISIEKLLEEKTKELLIKKDEFISIASHELKTPITTLKAILQILERSVAQKEELKPMHNFVQKANKQVIKLTELVTDLLDVTKIQSGNLELNKESFAIVKLLDECCEQTPDKPSNCQINVKGPEDVMVYADRNRIEQVVMNLVNNAIKYTTGANAVTINVTKEKRAVKITVTDHGIGIAKEKLDLLFDRYFRVEETSKNYAGLGLGLYISSNIVRRHGGDIGVNSELGKGSTFWFTIPSA
jgi:two-component system CheB/CheR fusion protein